VNYHNDNEPYVAEWLRNLIAAGLIPKGDIDERPIQEVQPQDLTGYTQCHFFAGIAGWPLALQLAGWPEDRPVWTGSCPCQPFSVAGKGAGTADARHLWPAWFSLIKERRPPVIFGEQVAAKAGREWLAGVRVDLETVGYEVGAADLCAASVGAPHRRQRLWWVAYAEVPERRRTGSPEDSGRGFAQAGRPSADGRMGDTTKSRCRQEHEDAPRGAQRNAEKGCEQRPWDDSGTGGLGNAKSGDGRLPVPLGQSLEESAESGRPSEVVGMGDASGPGLEGHAGDGTNGKESRRLHSGQGGPASQTGASGGRGFWADFDLIPCADGTARRIEPGTFPLADGISNRVGKLRAYGNAIVPQVAAVFIRAAMDLRLGESK